MMDKMRLTLHVTTKWRGRNIGHTPTTRAHALVSRDTQVFLFTNSRRKLNVLHIALCFVSGKAHCCNEVLEGGSRT